MITSGLLDAAGKCCLVAAFILLLPITALTIAELAFGYHSYTLLTREMSPSISQGSLLVSHPTDAAALKVGDLIAFHPPLQPDTLVTRRVVAVEPGPQLPGAPAHLVATRADSSATRDPWLVPSDAVVDRVDINLPFLGYPAAALQTRIGRFFFLALPASLLVLLFVNYRISTQRRLLLAVPRPRLV